MEEREREIMVARDVTDLLLADVMVKSKTPSLSEFAHAFGVACKNRDLVPDGDSYNRILFDVVNDIGERRRAADSLDRCLVRSTAELLEFRRKR